ncbi:TonB-dependent receptor plug domain-containing protein [Candidatus Nitronereus thalassa]|uniref:TonB-dependent receptor n=1 Tax=Candidatus Nitronereus thalassa TaxID=3020898 RepID=A0ABU3K712_9BACT|nr:TonB-dependent receptor [Candidatus Nitronereus thalassa]MDT7042128.1 TonB-dependent receptor [Candidatus Nitronereus thalassa]
MLYWPTAIFWFISFWTLAIHSSCNVLASEKEPIEVLDPIVITATASPTTLSQVPASVTIITREKIVQQQANRLSSILQQVPGIIVDEMGGRGGLSSVYLRGGDPNFTLIMIDGIPLNDPSNQRGGSVNLSILTPERIERIEIVRGPASIVYGSDAMAGAINIITRKGQSHSNYQATVEGGQFGYGRSTILAQGSAKDVLYSGSVAFTRNDEQVEGDRFQNINTGGNLAWTYDSSVNVQMTGQFTQSDIRAFPEGSGGSRLSILRATEQRLTKEFLVGITLTHQLSQTWKQQFSSNLFYRQEDVNNPGVLDTARTFRNPPTMFTTDFSRYRFLWTLTQAFAENWKLSGGFQLIYEDGQRTGTQQLTALGLPTDQRNDFAKTRTTPAGFLESVWKPFSHTTVTSGLRIDDPQEFSPEVTPRVAMSIQLLPETFVRSSYSEGFKLPSFNALGDPLIGNPSLAPEKSQGWDINVHQELFNKKIQLDLTYFHNRFSNVIDLDPILAKQNVFSLVNLSTVITNGVEFELTTLPYPWLEVQAFFTYLNTDILGLTDSLRNRPNTFGGFILNIRPNSRLHIRSELKAVGKRFDIQIPTTETTVPSYYRVDLTATLRVNDSWKIFVAGENLTNVQYEEFLGFEAPGVWGRFGLECQVGD